MSAYADGGRRRFTGQSLFGGFSFFPPVIKALLLSNIVIWLLFGVLLPLFTYRGVPIFAIFSEYLALWPLGTNFWPWQLLTYMFVHGGFGHLFFNMLALWMFGMELESTWGSRKFLFYYLVCGVGAGVANLLIAPLFGQAAPTVGASGAVFGVLLAFGLLYPDRLIYLYFLLPIKAKYFIAGYIGLELFYGVTGTTDGIAHVAHLGGAAVGFLFILIDRGLLPGRGVIEKVSGWKTGRSAAGSDGWRGIREVRDAKFYDITTGRERDNDPEITQEVVDEILDKINREGYQSLTDDEKRVLNEASKKIH
jgi:membrane associated rhomboid family serine protease